MIDIGHHINDVQRRVSSRVLEAGEAHVVTISRVYDAPLDDVWDACTNPERIPRWFLPVSGDLAVGGSYQLEGNAGGTIERCDPPKGFAATWEMGGEISWIDVRFTPETDERTRFELDHIAHVDDERWTQYGPGAVGVGWELGLVGLALHLAARDGEVDKSAVMAWSAAEGGRSFMTLSSTLWGEAHVAGGGEESGARAAAARTAAFYTGVPEE